MAKVHIRTFRTAELLGRADFSRATSFNLDELLGIDPRHPHSYRALMQRHLFGPVNLSVRRAQFLNGVARSVEREYLRYEGAVARARGNDLQILGLSVNGHIGFNEPARWLIADTHRTRLKPGTRRANAALLGGRASAVPRDELSMGMTTILRAKRIVLGRPARTKRVRRGRWSKVQ